MKLYKRFLNDWPLHIDTALQPPEKFDERPVIIESYSQRHSQWEMFHDPESILRREINLLSKAASRDTGTSRRTSMLNLELAAFAISLIQNVRLPFLRIINIL